MTSLQTHTILSSLELFGYAIVEFFALFPKLGAEDAVEKDVAGRVDYEEQVTAGDGHEGPEAERLVPSRLALHGVL